MEGMGPVLINQNPQDYDYTGKFNRSLKEPVVRAQILWK